MNSYSSKPGSRRNPRGGRRYNRGKRYPESSVPKNAQRPKLSLWQRFLALFKSTPNKYNSKPSVPSTSSERSGRPMVFVEVTSPRLYVGNLSFQAEEEDLMELFRGVGSVQSVEIASHRDTQRSKGFAFVTMATIEEAKRAVAELHDRDFLGRKLIVSGAKSQEREPNSRA
jgi:RNA recognition motif-containing protein